MNGEHKDVFLDLFSQPWNMILLAWEDDLFLKYQFLPLCFTVILAFTTHKKISGDTNYREASRYGAYGTARFARTREVFNDQMFVKRTWFATPEKNLQNPQGLIFGLFKQKPVILAENTKIPNRNVFVVGSPGSGKTQSYILTNIIHEQHRSIVVTDPKGEIYEATAKLKKSQGYDVRLINFKEMAVSDRYNPIDYIQKEIEAEQVATTIVLNSQDDKSKPDFWTRAEIALLKTLLLYVKYECPHEATMAKVKEILTKYGKTPQEMDRFFSDLKPEHPAYQAYMIVRMAEKNVRASIFISLGITLSKFDSTDVRKFTETSDFSLDDLGQKKMILYCILPVADATWEPLISTFFTQMFQRLYDVADKHYNRLPVKINLLLDEFPNLGQIPGYEEILATCRSYGISASTIIQSLGQLYDKYSKEKAEAIVGNCSLRFLLGVGDKMTAEYFSDLMGKTTIQTSSISKTTGQKGSDSTSHSYAERNLVTPDELTRMKSTDAILLVSGMFAIRLQKAFQYQFFDGILNKQMQTSRFDYFQLVGHKRLQQINIEQNVQSIEVKPAKTPEQEKREQVQKIELNINSQELYTKLKETIDLSSIGSPVTHAEQSISNSTDQQSTKTKKKRRRRRKKKKTQVDPSQN